MYSFEGNFRTAPQVSLGGKSKEKPSHSSSVIKNARVERQKREAARRELQSSIILQSSFRSFLIRKKLKEEFRVKFDEHRRNEVGEIEDAAKLLCYFYEKKVVADTERLIWICQRLLKNTNKNTSFPLLSKLLILCCRNLANDFTVTATSLRMLEVFTTLKNHDDLQRIKNDLYLWRKLMKNGFFSCMLHVFGKKVPEDIEPPSGHYVPPHLVLANSLLEIMKRPLHLLNMTCSENIPQEMKENIDETARIIFNKFITDVLSHAMTRQICNYILPSIGKDKNFPSRIFLFHLEQAVLPLSISNFQQSHVETSVELLSSFVSLYENYKASSDESDAMLCCLQWLVPTLPRKNEYEDFDSDDGDDVVMATTDQGDISIHEVISKCCRFLNSSKFVKQFMKRGYFTQSNITSLCGIAFHLTAALRQTVHTNHLLYSLAYSSVFLKSLWNSIISLETLKQNSMNSQSTIRALLDGGHMTESSNSNLMMRLVTFANLYSHNLLSLNDVDFYEAASRGKNDQTFKIHDIILVVTTLRDVCLSLLTKILPETRWKLPDYNVREIFQQISSGKPVRLHPSPHSAPLNIETAALAFKVCSRLLNQLHTRHTRRAFTKDDVWLSNTAMIGNDRSKYLSSNWRRRRLRNDNIAAHMADPSDEDLPMTITEARQLIILTCLPFVVPFETRVGIFTWMLNQDRVARASARDVLMQDAGFSNSSSVIQVAVRREFLYEDAFNDLSQTNAPDLRHVLRVTFVNRAGAEEAGYGEGVTREFLQQLVRTAFEPTRGLFQVTGESGLYPNPHAGRIIDNFRQHFTFLGRLLGKVLYEGMQIELPFASFFLCKLLRHKNVDVDINHLQSLDPDFYKNLMYLRSYEGDVADLDLNFTVVDDNFGETKVTELVTGGQDIAVTNENRVRYIHLLSNYKLNVQMRAACDAFRNGLATVVPLDWLRMFDHRELQTLISGAEVEINVDDMKVNAAYSGGYKADHPTIELFWTLLATLTEEEKRKLLLFVTSCSRPPLLGFKEMHPPFCLHNGGEADRLPTSSTCLNLLRLPQYTDIDTMRDKLLYCINSLSGFELS